MKKCFVFFIAVFFFIPVFAQLENTRWKTTLQIDNTPVNCLMEFKKDTALLYTLADSMVIESMIYTRDDTSFTLIRIEGQSSCGDIPGRYGFSIKDEHLTLTLLKDECYDRYNVIENTVWAKWKDYPGIFVSENILKQYTGVYALDAAHPITISLENGTLYAEGVNNGLPKSPFIPITESTFFLRIAGVQMDFIKDTKGNVVKIISHEQKDYELKKIK